MTDGIFHMDDHGNLTEMTEQPYDSEAILQQVLAEHPNLLAGSQISSTAPRRWSSLN